jgi:hypothetical protein
LDKKLTEKTKSLRIDVECNKNFLIRGENALWKPYAAEGAKGSKSMLHRNISPL